MKNIVFFVLLFLFNLCIAQENLEELIRELYLPEGKVRYLGYKNPGGPIFILSLPVKKLISLGNKVQFILLNKINDENIQKEIAIILSRVGDERCLSFLIKSLEDKDKSLSKKEELNYLCIVYALWRLTGNPIGINHKWPEEYSSKVKSKWQEWYNENINYLYGFRGFCRIDVEAKLARIPAREYREKNPKIFLKDIKKWQNTEEYKNQLYSYCYSVVINSLWNRGYWNRQSILALSMIKDKRSLSILHSIVEHYRVDPYSMTYILWALRNFDDVSSLPYLEKIAAFEDTEIQKDAKRQIRRIKLIKAYSKLKPQEKAPFPEDFYMEYTLNPKKSRQVVKKLKTKDLNYSIFDSIERAGFIKEDQVKKSLIELIETENEKFKDVDLCFDYPFVEVS